MWYPYSLPLHPLKWHPLPYIFITLDETPLRYDPATETPIAKKNWSEEECFDSDVCNFDEDCFHELSIVEGFSDLKEKMKSPEKKKPSNRQSFLKRVSQSSEDALTETMLLRRKVKRLTKRAKERSIPKRRRRSQLPKTEALTSKQLIGRQISEAWVIIKARQIRRRMKTCRWRIANGLWRIS